MGSAQGICLGGSAKGDGSAWGVCLGVHLGVCLGVYLEGLPRGSASRGWHLGGLGRPPSPGYSQWLHSTHPTGMHSGKSW